jgi:hypothetical protein
MKKQFITSIFALASLFTMAQNEFKISSYATISASQALPKDDKFYLSDNSIRFSQDAQQLFILSGYIKYGSNLTIYDLKDKKVIKNFTIPKNSKAYSSGVFQLNPANNNEIAVQTGNSEIKIINDWKTAPENVFENKKSVANTIQVLKIGDNPYSQWTYSADGKNIYVREKINMKVYDKMSINPPKNIKFDSKKYEWLFFLDKDQVLLVQKQAKEDVYKRKLVDIYNVLDEKISKEIILPHTRVELAPGNQQKRYLNDFNRLYDLEEQKLNEVVQSFGDKLRNEKKVTAHFYPVPNIKGYLMHVRTMDLLVFTSEDCENFANCPTGTDLQNVSRFDFSSNGKYFVYQNKNNNNEMIIWEMYP